MSNQKMIKVLIVEDSKVVATILESIFNADPNIEVIATATNGEEAVELTQKLKPDLITMDIEMPKLNGLEATTTIMRENPTPIIIITSLPTGNDSGLSFDALNAGALTIIEKPVDISSDGFQSIKQNLLRSVKALHDIHVIRRRVSKTNSPKSRSSEPNDFKILAIGASTGGPQALHYILSKIPPNFPAPIVVVQHITRGFLEGLIKWLKLETNIPLKIAENKEKLKQGTVYFAPDDFHMTIKKIDGAPTVSLIGGADVDFAKPSVTELFRSLAQSYPKRSVGVLLTGMGKDGANGLLEMHNNRCYTVAQDEKSAIVFGMPGAAINLGAVDTVLSLADMPSELVHLFEGENNV